jgi:polar amino acid transport system substrate-binding protein
VQGTVQEAYVIDTLRLQPVKFPDYNTVYASLKTRQIDAWVAPSQQASGTVQPGDPAQIIENTFSLDNFVAWAVAKENQPLIDALNSGLDAIIADGTWARLYSDWVPRALPPGWKPGSKVVPAPQLPDFNAIAAEHQRPASTASAPKSTLSQLKDSFLNWELYRQAVPDLFKTGLPNTLILTVSASVIGLVLGMALAVAGISRARWLRWPARVYTDIFRGLPEVPQGVRRVLPALMNQFISLLKASSLVYFLGLVANQRELFQVGRDLNAQTGTCRPWWRRGCSICC